MWLIYYANKKNYCFQLKAANLPNKLNWNNDFPITKSGPQKKKSLKSALLY